MYLGLSSFTKLIIEPLIYLGSFAKLIIELLIIEQLMYLSSSTLT